MRDDFGAGRVSATALRQMITRDDWLNALRQVSAPTDAHPDAVTAQEFATLIGLKRSAAKARLAELVKHGKAKCVRKAITNALGLPIIVPAYVLIKEIPDDRRASDRVERRAGRDRHAPPRRS